jgi:2-iminobutanoate/2-iminopropanoate deaminase
MSFKVLNSENIYQLSIAPVSVATSVDIGSHEVITTSGILGIEKESKVFSSDNAAEQADKIFTYLKHVLEDNGSSLTDVVKVLIFIIDFDDFANINKVYEKYFPINYPARSCVQVAKLPLGARLEVEAVAYKKKK